MAAKRDFYEILEIPKSASAEEEEGHTISPGQESGE